MNGETRVTVQQQRRTRSEIAQMVARFAESGLNRTEFCRRQGMCLGTLNRHLKRMRGSNTVPSDGPVPVELAGNKFGSDGDGGCSLAVVLSGGRRIEVRAGFDGSALQRMIALLERMLGVFGFGPATRIYLAPGSPGGAAVLDFAWAAAVSQPIICGRITASLGLTFS